MNAPAPSGRVLPTLNADGTRRRIHPRLYTGRTWGQRRAVAWGLMLVFLAIPWLRYRGKPLILLDVPLREFTLFGSTFLPTDGVLLMLFLLTIFVAIVLTTAVVGRAWCGWACPQTVYMEFLFRPIERLFEGSRERQLQLDRQGYGLRRLAKNAVFFLLAVVLGNTFLAYFVGTNRLMTWVQHSPYQRPEAFLVMGVVSLLAFVNFAYFREQMCTLVCPYARLQSVLLDRRSLIVGYDARRGEPRSRGKPKAGSGDCVDCRACVTTCPTGIDIREGLQLECIACAQCIDACDSIMSRLKKPLGLIRYGGQQDLETGQSGRLIRTRVVIYAGILGVLLTALVTTTLAQGNAEVIVLRGIGAPFEMREGKAVNQLRIKVRNRSEIRQSYAVELLDAPGATVIAPEVPLLVLGHAQRTTSIFVVFSPTMLTRGQRPVRLRVSDGRDFEIIADAKLLGPGEPRP